MATQLSVAARTAMAQAIETEAGVSPRLAIFTGAQPANCAAADPTGEVARLTLPADWVTSASGAITKAGTWSVAASAGAGATPASFRLFKTDGTTCVLQGSCGIGSGDLSVDGTITAGQTVTVTSFVYTIGNA